MRRILLVLLLACVAIAVPAEAATPAASGAAQIQTPVAAAPVLVLAVDFSTWIGAPGLKGFREHVRDKMQLYAYMFMDWGKIFYIVFFVIQFVLLGITMVVKGPFPIATHRPIHALNPFANFFFFLLAGTLGFLFIANSVVEKPYDPSTDRDKIFTGNGVTYTGWIPWLYTFFEDSGQIAGCDGGGGYYDASGTEYVTGNSNDIIPAAFGGVNPCNEESMAWIGTTMSAVLTLMSERSGTTGGNKASWFLSIGGSSTSVFAAFSVLAIQLTLIKIAFLITLFTAPLFLCTIVFKPFSGIANGYVSFIAYLGVKLMILQLVAGLASYIAHQWIETLFADAVMGFLTSLITTGTFQFGDTYSMTASITILSLLFLSMTLYLPTKIAGMVSQRLNIDLNGILFRGEFPVQIS